MARKGGRGGNKAARSAAAKKGWETRRRGGAKPKPAVTKRTAASKPKGRPLQSSMARAERVANAASRKQYAKQLKSLPKNARRAIQVERLARRSMQPEMYKPLAGIAEGRTRLIANAGKKRGGLPSAQVRAISRSMASSASRIRELLPKPKPAAKQAAKTTKRRGGMPKTTSARGRALTNQRRAADLVRASRGGKGPSAKAVRSVLTAQRARAFYTTTGGGKKRSAVKAKSAAKVGKSIRAESRAKATAARAKVVARAADKARTVAYFRNARPAAGASRSAAMKPAAPPKGSLADTKMQWAKGDLSVHKERQKVLNQKLKDINAKIKEAGPSAGSLRLEKLKIQDSLAQVRRDVASAKTRSKPAATAPIAPRVNLGLDGFVRRQRRAKDKLDQIVQQQNRSDFNERLYNRGRLLRAAVEHLVNARREYIVGSNPRSAVLAGLKPRTRRR